MSDTYVLPRITNGVAGEAAIKMLNAPIQATETALNELLSKIAGLNNKSAIILQNVPLDATVNVGNLVYYDASNSIYKKAIAKLRTTPMENGASIESEEARVCGVIITKDQSTITGTLLLGGYWNDVAVCDTMLGTDADSGTYYLSPTTAGVATQDPDNHLRQPILTYFGDGKFSLNIFYMAHDNHFHSSCTLHSYWKPASEAPVTAPEGATYYYALSADPTCVDLGDLDTDTTVVFYQGILNYSQFWIEDGYLWTSLDTIPGVNTVKVFNHYPFAYGAAILRQIESTTDELSISVRNGTAKLTLKSFSDGGVLQAGTAISDITESRSLIKTPIVSKVYAGPGIVVTSANNGAILVSSNNIIDTYIDADSYSYNGANYVSDGIFSYYTFPKGRKSEIIITKEIPYASETVPIRIKAYLNAYQTSAPIIAKFYYVPQPSNTTACVMPTTQTTPDLTTNIPLVTCADNSIICVETNSGLKVTKPGVLYVRLSITNEPTADIKCQRIGVIQSIDEGLDIEVTSDALLTEATAVTYSLVAGETIAAFSAVKTTSTGLMRCLSSVKADAGKCSGIAVTSGNSGTKVKVITSGIVTDDSAFEAFSIGAILYIDSNGGLTSTAPTTGFVQIVGKVLSSRTIEVNIDQAVRMID